MWRRDSAVFDEDNLVSHAGLVPLLELAERAGLLDEHVRFTSERVRSGAANSTAKLTSIVAGMAAEFERTDRACSSPVPRRSGLPLPPAEQPTRHHRCPTRHVR
jgi:hypothetical protein